MTALLFTLRNGTTRIEFSCRFVELQTSFSPYGMAWHADLHLSSSLSRQSVLQAFQAPNNSIHALLIHIYMLILAPKLFYITLLLRKHHVNGRGMLTYTPVELRLLSVEGCAKEILAMASRKPTSTGLAEPTACDQNKNKDKDN